MYTIVTGQFPRVSLEHTLNNNLMILVHCIVFINYCWVGLVAAWIMILGRRLIQLNCMESSPRWIKSPVNVY